MITSMQRGPRRHASDESGFTLIELLVVILIVGILAAIAIPAFLNQKGKANDASAKALARTAATTAETYATDHNGSYESISALELNKIEPTISTSAGNNNAYLSGAEAIESNKGYTVTATASNGHTYTITRTSAGVVERTCTGTQGGCVNGSW
jgi:type IV pilus assembly protein PilA